MKQILLSLTFISVSIMTLAQSARQAPPPNTGNFYVTTTTAKGQERINVGYTLLGAPFTTTVNMHLVVWEPMMLTAKIMNDNSEMVMNWAPSKIDKQYAQQFDISNFRTGKYHIEIYGPDGKKVYTIDFEKQSGASSPASGTSK